jgi:hypothetical protein
MVSVPHDDRKMLDPNVAPRFISGYCNVAKMPREVGPGPNEVRPGQMVPDCVIRLVAKTQKSY